MASLVVLGEGATPGAASGGVRRAAPGASPLPAYRDGQGEFGRIYAARHGSAFLVRPDGCLGARLSSPSPGELAACLAPVFRT